MTSVASYQRNPSYPKLFGSSTVSTLSLYGFGEGYPNLPKRIYELSFDPSLFNRDWEINLVVEFLPGFKEQRKINVIQKFASRLIENSIDIDPVFARIAKDSFWDMV